MGLESPSSNSAEDRRPNSNTWAPQFHHLLSLYCLDLPGKDSLAWLLGFENSHLRIFAIDEDVEVEWDQTRIAERQLKHDLPIVT